MRKKLLLAILLVMVFCFSAYAVDHQMYTDFLKEHVDRESMVNYRSACEDARLKDYIDILAQTDPANIKEDDARLAFWINAYNAYTIKIICDNYPLGSINELHTGGLILGSALGRTVWHRKNLVINQQPTSLHIIEHEIMRKEFDEPRIHFALVCAAKGCPPLRNEAFEGQGLDAQLQDQAVAFFRQQDKNRVDIDSRTVFLSPIFSWFSRDFGRNRREALEYILPFLSESDANAVRDNISRWRVRYTHYDWSLNEQ